MRLSAEQLRFLTPEELLQYALAQVISSWHDQDQGRALREELVRRATERLVRDQCGVARREQS